MSLGFSPLSVSASIPRLHFLHTAPYFPTPLEKHLNTGDAQKTVCAAFLSHVIPLPCSLLCSLSFLSIKLQKPLWKLLQAGQLASSRRCCPPLARNHLPQNILLPIFFPGPARPSVHDAYKSISCGQSCSVAPLCSHRCHPAVL